MRNSGSPIHSNKSSLGFSLLEMLIAVAVVSAVMAVVMRGIIQMQQRSNSESMTVDVSQQTRDFIDQMVRDIHNVGYPPPQVVTSAVAAGCTANVAIACGVISYTPTQIIYEGDLDGSGTVYRVYVQLQPGAGGTCPCILQRGAIRKSDALAGTAPTYFTEVNGVLNSGNGAGTATYAVSLPGPGSYSSYGTADVFDAYDVSGTAVGTCATIAACSSIHSVQITANIATSYGDSSTKTYRVFSITSKARMNNNNPVI
jgi:prepilin-type N-terminal cleavage/methylation domain-containing protein